MDTINVIKHTDSWKKWEKYDFRSLPWSITFYYSSIYNLEIPLYLDESHLIWLGLDKLTRHPNCTVQDQWIKTIFDNFSCPWALCLLPFHYEKPCTYLDESHLIWLGLDKLTHHPNCAVQDRLILMILTSFSCPWNQLDFVDIHNHREKCEIDKRHGETPKIASNTARM